MRQLAGKPSAGNIAIRTALKSNKQQIHIQDDGQGIDIDRLFKNGVTIGKWCTHDQPTYADIAELIFVSGVSTKEQVTNISGHGVGMDAVKEFLLAQGGNIYLKLLGPNAQGNQRGRNVMIPFELVVELRKNTFTVLA